MNIKKAGIITLTASSLLIATLILAQDSSTPDTSVQQVRDDSRGGPHGHHGFGDEMRGMGFPLRGLGLGTTATITFYDGDPEAGGAVVNTLTFNYGQDSEVAFAQQFEEARANAAYMKVDLSEQTRTVDLSTVADDQRGDLRPRELGRLDRLNDGSTVTAAFYNSDPATAGTTATETLTFTYGTSSAAGFANDFATAAKTASFVTITTSPQSYTVNLADMQNGPDFQDRRGPGQDGPNQDGPEQPR
jgi:hypothetical protein